MIIGSAYGVAAADVTSELAEFEAMLMSIVERLDARYPSADDLDTDGLEAIIELAARAHAEWVRIRPFANAKIQARAATRLKPN